MQFRLVKPDTVQLPVTVTVPGGDTAKVNLRVRYLGIEEIRELVQKIEDPGLTDAELAEEIAVGWDVADENGNPLDFTKENLRAAMDLPYFCDAVAATIVDYLFRGRQKNLLRPAESGRPAEPR